MKTTLRVFYPSESDVPGGILLDVSDLRVTIETPRGAIVPCDRLSFCVGEGEIVALVGESGSGKTMTALATIGLLPNRARIMGGSITFEGVDLAAGGETAQRLVRGRRIGYVPQDATCALNPVMRIGTQISEPLRRHLGLDRRRANTRAISLLRSVGIPDPENRVDAYPGELSGGMCQRVAIAIAVACDPTLVIADEPTTALDVTIQAEVIELLLAAARERHMAVLLVSHDLGMVSSVSHRTLVMYAARIVESGPTPSVHSRPRHPYTEALLRSTPRLRARQPRLSVIPGRPPDLLELPDQTTTGCRFYARCPYGQHVCLERDPVGLGDVQCWFPRSDQNAHV